MHKLYPPLALCAVLAVATVAHADDYANLSVTGTINPQACTPSLTTAQFDFGSKNYTDLSDTEWTQAPEKADTLTITCPSATATYWGWVDNYALGVDGYDHLLPGGVPHAFGTDTKGADGNPVALYQIFIDPPTSDGNLLTVMARLEEGPTEWGRSTVIATHDGVKWVYTAGGYDVTTPTPAVTTTFPMRIHLFYGPRNGLALTDDVTFNGSATFTVYYP